MRPHLRIVSLLILALASLPAAAAPKYESHWPEKVSRVWAGPDFWVNRLQDWQIRLGRLECTQVATNMPMRTAHLLTADLREGDGGFEARVRLGMLEKGHDADGNSWSGFLIGAGQGKLDYRAAAIVHHLGGGGGGIIAAIDDMGRLVFRSNEKDEPRGEYPPMTSISGDGYARSHWEDIELTLRASASGGSYTLTLEARDTLHDKLIGRATLDRIPEARLRGNVALVSHGGSDGRATRYWFRNLQLSGDKIALHPDRAFGPVLGAIYSLSDGVMKMTAQFPPLGFADADTVKLLVRPAGSGEYREAASTIIVEPGYTAHFRLAGWDDSRDHDYIVRYENNGQKHDYPGLIRKDPKANDEIVVAGFTGNQVMGKPADGSWGENRIGSDQGRWTPENLWFPHNQMIESLPKHSVDLLVFTGDQIYEGGNPTNSDHRERNPDLDYLYKWYLWHWAYAPVVRNTPSVHLVDDHDVYQGDLWGDGGTRTLDGVNKNGAYLHEAGFVRMVERTQCAHNPDPFDPTPIKQGIGVYYTAFRWGGIGFAIIEDRKFKSLPYRPEGVEREGSSIINPGFDPATVDKPEFKLLGDRQIKFLEQWVDDWEGQKMKVGLTQTIFASLHTGPQRQKMIDQDSNGWPQSARHRALRTIRKGHVFLLGGDTHLASVLTYGVDDYNDAGVHFCVPAVANKYRRWWDPAEPGQNRAPGSPSYTGRQTDGFGNKITVHAIGNSKITPLEVLRQNEQFYGARDFHILLTREMNADGYGIVRLQKPAQKIVVEAWPWNGQPGNGNDLMRDWPITFDMADMYGREASGWLPTIKLEGLADAVVQVIDEETGETVYTTRAKDGLFKPKVFRQSTYTVRIGEPGAGDMKVFEGVKPRATAEAATLTVRF